MAQRFFTIGEKVGRLTILEELEPRHMPSGRFMRQWHCVCDCGNYKNASYEYLNYGKVPSCGCYKKEKTSEALRKAVTTHGHRHERLYGVWAEMKNRCEKPQNKEYHRYGGRGIKVCTEWHDYAVFRKWAYDNGYDDNAARGSFTLDRIDNDGNYCPDNCKFSDMKEQANNTSTVRFYKWNGSMYTISQIMEISKTQLSRNCLKKRLHKGMSVEEALSKPKMKNQFAQA